MAIEPIKGFYVHDEETGTDGVARYDLEAVQNGIVNPSLFEIGNVFMSANGFDYTGNPDKNRVRMKPGVSLSLSKGDKIYLTDNTNARYYIGYFDTNTETYHPLAWYTAPYTVPADGYEYVFLLAFKDSSTLDGDMHKLLDLFRIETSTPDVNFEPVTSNFSQTAIDNINDLHAVDYSRFEIGNIYYSTSWTWSDSTSRVRTKEGAGFHVDAGDMVYSTGDVVFFVGIVKEDESLWADTNWRSALAAPYAGECYVVARYSTETQISDKGDVLQHIHFSDTETAPYVDVKRGLSKTLDMPTVDYGRFVKKNRLGKAFIAPLAGFANADCPYGVPNLDTKNKRFVIPADYTILFDADTPGTRYHSAQFTSIDLTTVNSSAKAIYFDNTTKQFFATTFNGAQADDQYLFATIRFGLTGYKDLVCMSSPYSIDGKLYGVDALTSDNIEPISWVVGENVKGVNHRGFNTAPENTLPAYKLSKKQGFKYCECDVSMTSDRVPVLLHDDTINRTARNADGTAISETISIGSITYEEALEYDFGIYKSSEYAGTEIPKFEDFIILCRNLGLHPYIELKTAGGYTEAEIQNLVDIVHDCGMDGKVSWISFGAGLLTYVKNYDSSARLGYVVGDVDANVITTAQGLKTADNDVFIDAGSALTAEEVSLCSAADIPLEVWTVNSESTIQSLDPYVSGVTSDNLIAAKVLYDANKD